jgi:hypothetical protein
VRKVLNALPPLVPLVTRRGLMGGTRWGTVSALQIIAQEDALGPLPPLFGSSATIRRLGLSIVVKLRRRSSDGSVDLRPLEQPEIVTKFSIGIRAPDDFVGQRRHKPLQLPAAKSTTKHMGKMVPKRDISGNPIIAS